MNDLPSTLAALASFDRPTLASHWAKAFGVPAPQELPSHAAAAGTGPDSTPRNMVQEDVHDGKPTELTRREARQFTGESVAGARDRDPACVPSRLSSSVLQVAAPRMRALAQSRQINVGLAAADRDEMVYLESIRYSRRVAFRNVVSGQRVPMELTSLGRAFLASTTDARRKALFALFRQRRGTQWPALAREIELAMESVHTAGFCAASWQAEVVALATPLQASDATYSLNVSVSTSDRMEAVVDALAEPLLRLRREVLDAMELRAEE